MTTILASLTARELSLFCGTNHSWIVPKPKKGLPRMPKRAVDPRQAFLLSQNRQAIVQSRPDGLAGDGDADGVDHGADLDLLGFQKLVHHAFERFDVERRECGQSIAE